MNSVHSDDSASTLIALSDTQKGALLTAVREAVLVSRAQPDEEASQTFTGSAERIPTREPNGEKCGRSDVDSVPLIDLPDPWKDALWSAVLEAKRDAIAFKTVVEFQPELSFEEELTA